MAASLPRELERLDLPVNFSFGVTRDGRIFFIDDRIQATSWLHPLTGKPIQTGHKSVQGLPIGWEQAVTPEGAVYYIDHNGKGTTFEHPVTGRTANHVLPPPPTRSPPQSPVQSPTPKKSPNKQRHLKAPSASRDDSSMVTMRGWLYRQESGIKPWKKRWCVLADFCLFVYKDDKEHNSIGSILLPSYRIHQCTASDTHRKFAFKTEHDNMKTCLFASDNQDDMNRWINALKLAAMLKGPPLKEKEKNNNTTKLIPKSAFMEWEDVGTDALAKVGRAQQQQDQVQGQTPSPHPQRQGQPHYPPQNINQNPKSAFDPYQGRHPENNDRHLPQNDPMRGPPRNPHDGQNPDTSFEQDPRYRHPSGYDPRHNPQDRADLRHKDRYYDQGQPSANDPHSRDPRHSHSDPRQQHPSGYDPRNHDTSYREQDGYDPRNQHPSGYHDGRNRDQSPQDPYHRGSRHDPQGRPVENDQYRYDPNESRRSDEMDSRYNPQSGSHDPRRSEMDPPYARANRSDPRKSEVEPPYARPHKSNNDPRQHHQKENGYIPGLDRDSTLGSSRPDRESQSDRRYPQDRPNDQRYPEHDRRGLDNQRRTHSDDDPYIQMRPTDRDLKRDDQKRSSVQKLQDWQRQELERHKYGMPTKSDIVTPRSNDQSQNSEFYGYYSPKREAMERQRSNNLNDSRNSETFQKELHSDEPEDGYSTLTKYQTRDSLRPQNQPSQSSHPRSDNRSRSDSSSPKRNPDLMIDVGHTYVNFPRDPYEESRNEIPNRPPLPTAVRQQIVEELAQTKTPHTSKELIDAEMALEKRMQQPSYFEYPTPSEPNKSFLQGQQPDQHGYRYGDDRYNDTGGHHDSRQNYPEQNVSRSLFGQPPSSEVDRDLHMMDHQQDPYSDRRGDRYGDRQQNRFGGESQRNPYGDSRPRYDASNDKISEPKTDKTGKTNTLPYGNKDLVKSTGSQLSSPKSSSTSSSQPLKAWPKTSTQPLKSSSATSTQPPKSSLTTSTQPPKSSLTTSTQPPKSLSNDGYSSSLDNKSKRLSNSSIGQRSSERSSIPSSEKGHGNMTEGKNVPSDKVEAEKRPLSHSGLDRSSNASLGLSNQSFESSEERRSAFRPLQNRSRENLPTRQQDRTNEYRYVPFPGPVAKGDKDQTDTKKRLSTASSHSQGHTSGDEGQRKGDNRRDKGKPKGLGTIHTVKEDPNMPDSDVIETEIPQLGNKYPALSGQRLRMSICASDLIGKTHDELVLMLIQLRREYTSLEKELFFYREKLEQRRPNEHQYRRMRQESDGPFSEAIEIEHRQYKDLKYQCEEVSKKLEVFRPIVNLVHNMVNMGSLYGGDNFMLASQYRKHLLSPDEITPPKKMLEFSRKHQEEQIVKGIKEDIRQLTSEEVDLEDKLERLYELDRLIQEQSFRVTSLQEDRDLLDKALQGILRQQDMHRDNPRELDRLIYQQRTIEKELSKVMHELAEASKELEETTAENNRIEHEVALLRSKVNDNLTRSKSAPSLSDENFRTKMMMEKDLAKVQNIMQGLNQQGARLSEAMNTLRRSSAGASLGAALSHDKMDYRQPKEKSTYMETDVDTSESKDLAQVTEILQSYQSQRSLASNEQREEPLSPTVTVGVSSKPVPRHRHQPPPHNMLDNELSTDAIEGDVQDGPWDIGDADDNTKRFFGIIPKEKPKLLTVRDVKRQAEQRKERDKLRRDDWNYDGENDQDEDQGYGTGGSSKYSDGNHPIYENLPPERKSSSWQSIQPLKNKTTSSQPRRPSLVHLVTPRPFVPFNSQNSGPSSLSNSSSTNLGYSSLLSPVSDDGIVKATRVIIQPAFASDNIDSDNSNERPDYTPKGWSPVKTGLFNVKRTPQGRYMTISSSEPVKLETSLIQPATLHTSAGDLIPGNTMDIPDIVKSSTTKMDQIDDATIEREILAVPEKVYIPERYMPDSDEDEDITEEEQQIRQEKSEKIKRILTQQSVHSISQPDVSKVADQVHQQVQQEKIKRAHLLEVSQELARQVTIKSRQAAAERRKTWSGSPSKTSEDIMNQIIPDTDVPYNSYDHHDGPTISQNMYI